MVLKELAFNGKKLAYDAIYKGATAFPYSNDLMHIGLIGALPFLIGKYSAELIGTQIPSFREYSDAIGFASSAATEILWQFLIEPASPYDINDRISDYKGVLETAIGAGLTYIAIKALLH